ncbi:hypothetical protein WL30_24575 [Burkholderia ubonensis]|uniref:hypothetical protein n=1 Tax=Burkholderia ubonensis TaxID=101571 RepID=UPI00075E44FC|nr:hypothetical protein [Burkholderia ubonensis]KWA81691.1 hypothetical protein WL30_24575 [Burkholderia ubonensis]KWB34711.1 hypothetical protein WL31_22265 [Burkholderia ubonensis]
MEHLVRILNDDDRQTLAWLRTHVGDGRVADAARRLIAQREPSAGGWAKPYISAVCRYLGVWPPTPRRSIRADTDHGVADRHLEQMRQLLAERTATVRRSVR